MSDAKRAHGAQEPDFRACTSLRSVICGGEAMRASLMKLFASLLPHARLYNDYGPTEATVASTGGRSPCACTASCSAAAQPP
jgi:non-ribosomal peptide synthetase component F